MEFTYAKGDDGKVSANFTVNEFACKGKGCCNMVKIDVDLILLLQKIRDYTGSPVTINSGYRCEKHNEKVGGAKASYHMSGKAADITVKGMDPKQVAKVAESLGAKGIGLYPTFVHVDVRPNKYYWDNSTGKEVLTFIEDKGAAMAAEIRAVIEKYGY